MSITITNRQGKQLSVYVEGNEQGQVIVLSNSLGTDYNMWQAQANALAQQFRVIRYDTRGHGQSDVISDTSIVNLAEDVIDILDALNIEKAHFCGISMGGLIALQLAIQFPERLLSITIANSAAKIWTTENWLARADAVEEKGLDDIVATTHTRWFSEQFDYKDHNLAQQTIQSLAQTPSKGYAQSCRALAYADLREQLSQIHVPSLVIAGQYDPVTTIVDAEFLQQHINQSQLVILAASHLSNIEQPEKFTQALLQFIENIQ